MRSLFILITLAVILAVAAIPALAAGNNQQPAIDRTASPEAVQQATADTREVAVAAFVRANLITILAIIALAVGLAALLVGVYNAGRQAGTPVEIFNINEAIGQQAYDWRYRRSTYYPPPPPPAPGTPPPPPTP